MEFKIYTDGACSGNPGPGGWGAVFLIKKIIKKISQEKKKILPIIEWSFLQLLWALKKIKNNSDVLIYTDSTYVKNGITEWITNWKKNGWKNANKKPVKNKDLWIKLDNLCEKNNVSWKWVKGHSVNKYNNLADKLATEAIKN